MLRAPFPRNAPRPTLMQLWKQGWNEIPEVMASSAYLIIALIGMPCYAYYYVTRDIGNRRYKNKYLVYRPEDPRVQRLKIFPDSPPTTKISKKYFDIIADKC